MGKLIDFLIWERTKVKVLAFLTVVVCALLAYISSFALSAVFLDKFMFYLGGMLLGSVDFDRLRRWHSLFVSAAVASVAVMALVAVFGLPHVINRICSIVLVCASFLAFRTSRIDSVPRWVKSLDTCSMGIYIVHHIVIQSMNRTDLLHPLLVTHYYVYPSLQFVVVLLFSWGFVWTLRRYSWARYFGL